MLLNAASASTDARRVCQRAPNTPQFMLPTTMRWAGGGAPSVSDGECPAKGQGVRGAAVERKRWYEKRTKDQVEGGEDEVCGSRDEKWE